jgi:hypothetical protein
MARVMLGILAGAFALVIALGSPATVAALSGATANGVNSFQAAGSFCTAPGSQTVNADIDSWIDQVLPITNHGSDTALALRSSLLQNRRTLVRFPLPTIPSRCSVTGAVLRLFSTSSQGTRTIQALRVNSAWTESGVTWLNQPSVTGSAATASSGAGWIQWAVTSQVQSMYTGSNQGFLVRDATEDAVAAVAQSYSSREAASNRPDLVITFG